MKTKLLAALFSFLFISIVFSAYRNLAAIEFQPVKDSGTLPQNESKKKPDYMSTFLSRDTKPLGLKEDLALKKLLNQPNIKWAIRAGKRHILD